MILIRKKLISYQNEQCESIERCLEITDGSVWADRSAMKWLFLSKDVLDHQTYSHFHSHHHTNNDNYRMRTRDLLIAVTKAGWTISELTNRKVCLSYDVIFGKRLLYHRLVMNGIVFIEDPFLFTCVCQSACRQKVREKCPTCSVFFSLEDHLSMIS